MQCHMCRQEGAGALQCQYNDRAISVFFSIKCEQASGESPEAEHCIGQERAQKSSRDTAVSTYTFLGSRGTPQLFTTVSNGLSLPFQVCGQWRRSGRCKRK